MSCMGLGGGEVKTPMMGFMDFPFTEIKYVRQ